MLTCVLLSFLVMVILVKTERPAGLDSYCGRDPLPDYPDSNADSKIVSVHTFFRHGTRADYRRTTCFANDAHTSYTSHLQSQFDLTGIAGGIPRADSLTKRYKRGFQVGELLDYSQIQMKRLADYLQKSYPIQYNADSLQDLYLRSTDIQRTLGSMDLLLTNIATGGSTYPSLIVETDDFDYDSLNLNCQSCPRAVHISNSFPTSPAYQTIISSEEFVDCAQVWKSEIGTPFDISQAYDCLIAPTCADVPLPLGLIPSESLLRCVLDIAMKIRKLRYASSQGVEFCQLAIAPFIEDLLRVSQEGKSSLWATHDDTLVCILSGSGLWDGTWPSYASFISFETFADQRVRVLRDGMEIGWLRNMNELQRPDIQLQDGYTRACSENDERVMKEDGEPSAWRITSFLTRVAGVVGLVGVVAYL